MSSEAKLVRLYEGKNLAENYDKYRPTYPLFIRSIILEQLKNLSPGVERFQRMLDVGCGGGQATFMFENDFDSILGIDISEAQIEKAKEVNKSKYIEFQVTHDNLFPVADESVDLVTAATAVHWFDLDIFVKECERVLKPNGCVVLYSYAPYNAQSADRNDSMGKYSCEYADILLEFLHDCKAHPRNYKYLDMYKVLFEEIKNNTKRWISTPTSITTMTLNTYLHALRTIGDYPKFMDEEKPDFDPLQALKKKIKKYVGLEDRKDEDTVLKIKIQYPMICFQKQGVKLEGQLE